VAASAAHQTLLATGLAGLLSPTLVRAQFRGVGQARHARLRPQSLHRPTGPPAWSDPLAGCILAFAITFPLVFGWIHFETEPGRLDWYRTYVFGFPGFAFPVHSLVGFLTFHGLVWASFAVIAGVMLAMRRRMRDHGAAALQKFGEDFLPLILLFAISVTGLMLTASYTWMKGYGYEFLSLLHAVTVIFTLLYLPFGKFFHLFQRPAQLGVAFYKDIGPREGMAHCARCKEPYASQMHVDDLITVEKELGYRYEMIGAIDHYQRICPACRRSLMAIAQGSLWQKSAATD
jgi:hypothetical protein